MYMLREVCQAERGKAPEIVAAFKTLDQWFEKAGYTHRRIYVDYTGAMDTVVYQWEFESLDQYFTMERGTFIEPDEDTQALIDAMNTNARSGYKEISGLLGAGLGGAAIAAAATRVSPWCCSCCPGALPYRTW